MSVEQAAVFAVIPASGAAEGLGRTVTSLLHRNFEVIVANGALGDDYGRFQAEIDKVRNDITVLRGADGATAAGLRNEALRQGPAADDHDSILHYLSADAEISPPASPALVRAAVAPDGVGAAVGVITDLDNLPDPFMYGPAFTPRAFAGGFAQTRVHDQVRAGHHETARGLRHLLAPVLRGYPDTTSPDAFQTAARDARPFWGQENNFVIPTGTLAAIGGFPPEQRFHQAQVIGAELQRRKLGIAVATDLQIKRPVETDQVGLQLANLEDAVRVIRRYGIGSFLTGRYAEHPSGS